MVLDNADDDGMFFSGSVSEDRGPLVSFLPQAAHGSMLIKSHNGLVARNLVGCYGHVIEIQPMNEEESLALLRARIPAPQYGEISVFFSPRLHCHSICIVNRAISERTVSHPGKESR